MEKCTLGCFAVLSFHTVVFPFGKRTFGRSLYTALDFGDKTTAFPRATTTLTVYRICK